MCKERDNEGGKKERKKEKSVNNSVFSFISCYFLKKSLGISEGKSMKSDLSVIGCSSYGCTVVPPWARRRGEEIKVGAKEGREHWWSPGWRQKESWPPEGSWRWLQAIFCFLVAKSREIQKSKIQRLLCRNRVLPGNQTQKGISSVRTWMSIKQCPPKYP